MIAALCLALDKPMDGDTFWTCDGVKVRLVAASGPLDAPETRHSPRCRGCDPRPGEAARARLRALLAHGGEIRCAGHDRYDRALCRVRVNGQDVGDQMIREGHAVLRLDWQK